MGGGTMGGAGGGRAPISGINITPMVDVVLVLLVIMMVSATYIVSKSLKVELPKTIAGFRFGAQLLVGNQICFRCHTMAARTFSHVSSDLPSLQRRDRPFRE